jgi:hypothetical protein
MQLTIARFFEIDNPLIKYASNVSSQDGEDGIIEFIIKTIAPDNSYCVEFGAWDGKYCSNCFNLIENRGWAGAMIEANSEKYKELVQTYANNPKVSCVNKFVQFDSPNSLDDILDEVQAPAHLGVLSIDIDGNDYHVWKSLKRYHPELVVIEFNPTVPNDVIFVQERAHHVTQGCSLLALILLGKEKGYELVCCTRWNAFFVKKEKYPLFGIQDNLIFRMYAPIQDGRIFQGYDSYIHVAGFDRLVWKGRLPVSSENFQVLEKDQRVFSDAQALPPASV